MCGIIKNWTVVQYHHLSNWKRTGFVRADSFITTQEANSLSISFSEKMNDLRMQVVLADSSGKGKVSGFSGLSHTVSSSACILESLAMISSVRPEVNKHINQ